MSNEFPSSPILGVGAVIVKDGKALIVKRANDPYKGQWSIPGGRVELGETLTDAVRREMREETGLEVRVGSVIEVFERVEREDDRIRHHFVIVDYLCTCVGGALCAGDDAVDAVWVTSEGLEAYRVSESAVAVIRKALSTGWPG
ncbi:MAG TPA: NUDIX hydrolase [Vicinamibacterales bacterium]|nr:NUDIX hydrolase [Vicinamibacterales bacterium]